MPFITWNEKFDVRVRELNAQHRKLFDMINDLHDALFQGKSREVLGKTLMGLVGYTKMHFSSEEKYMVSYGYPEYTNHKAQHGQFVRKVLDFQKDFDEGKLGISLDVMNFLTDWLSSHILAQDTKYGPFFNAKGLI